MLLWAVNRVARGLRQFAPWSEAGPGIRAMFNDYGSPDASNDPEYPVVALARTRLWELDGHRPPPWKVDVRQ